MKATQTKVKRCDQCNLVTKKGTLRKKWVEIYHSEESGVRVSI